MFKSVSAIILNMWWFQPNTTTSLIFYGEGGVEILMCVCQLCIYDIVTNYRWLQLKLRLCSDELRSPNELRSYEIARGIRFSAIHLDTYYRKKSFDEFWRTFIPRDVCLRLFFWRVSHPVDMNILKGKNLIYYILFGIFMNVHGMS